MPPRKYKTDHRRGGGSKHISSADDVKARNDGEMSAYDKARAERAYGKKAAEDEEEEEVVEEEKPEVKKPVRRPNEEAVGEVCNLNAQGHGHVDQTGVELTRKQREEIDRERARRRYEELHKAGKTDEAKADLARLEEVKKRREDALKKKADEQAAKEVEVVDAKAVGRSALIKELKASGAEASKKGGAGKKDKDNEDGDKKKSMNGAEVENIYSFVSSEKKVKEEGSRFQATDGTIEACREAEADFM